MNLIAQSKSILAGNGTFQSTRRPGCFGTTAVIAVLIFFTFTESATAQYFYRGYRPRGPVVIAPPIMPSPYYGAVWPAPPVILGPPSSVRVQTPFFSMNIGPSAVVPSAIVQPGYPIGGYTYESYRPRYEYGYSYSVPDRYADPAGMPQSYGTRPYEPQSYAAGNNGLPIPDERYRASSGGGIPEITVPPAASIARYPAGGFSLSTLRRSAESLRESLQRRSDDADVWLDYLQPDTIIADVVEGRPSDSISILLTRYDGVTQNPDLSPISRLPGFNQIRQQLAMWLEIDGIVTAQSTAVPDAPTDAAGPSIQSADDPEDEAATEIEQILPGPIDQAPREQVPGEQGDGT
ncbi:MAG: hypothetical protein KDB00_20100 [Planctomycetales bacterium]|nr:hypothetical protein [Planctomycetales bacterium]